MSDIYLYLFLSKTQNKMLSCVSAKSSMPENQLQLSALQCQCVEVIGSKVEINEPSESVSMFFYDTQRQYCTQRDCIKPLQTYHIIKQHWHTFTSRSKTTALTMKDHQSFWYLTVYGTIPCYLSILYSLLAVTKLLGKRYSLLAVTMLKPYSLLALNKML